MVKEKGFYKLLAKIALPVALQSLISLGVVMLDNIMVGSLGDSALSAVGQANQVTLFFMFFIRGVSGGASTLISQYWGAKSIDRIKSVFTLIFQICAGFSIAVTILVFLKPEMVMRVFTNELSVIDIAKDYITIVCFSYVLYALSDCFIAMLRCVEVVKLTLYISIISFFTNLFFNYVLIFGKFGFPELGVKGSAIATVIARGIELIIVLFYFFFVQKVIKMKVFEFFKSNKAVVLDFLKYGLPITIGDIQWGLIGVFKAMIIGRLGVNMMAANNITDTVMQLGLIFNSGLSSAACLIIGKTIGEKNYEKTRQYSNTIQIIFLGVGVLMGTLVFTLRAIPVSFYDVSLETSTLAMQMLAIGAFTLIGSSYHAACFTGINRGAGDSHFVFKVDMICGWLIVLPASFLAAFIFKFPLPIVFLFTKIDQCFKWIIAFIRLKGNKWIHNIIKD